MRMILPGFILLLAACTPRGDITMARDPLGVGTVEPIFVGTTRAAQDGPDLFGDVRSEKLGFARYDVSIPPSHEPGAIEWPRTATPDARRHMVTVAEARYDSGSDFSRALAADLQRQPKGERDAVVFVHGYNNRLAEGVYRIAQLTHDLELSGSIVHYAWPSAGKPLGYVKDRDSAMFARDGLEEMLRDVAAANPERVVLIAHSLGSSLMMESLRQIALRGDRALLNRITAVVLISPDIDVDVFRSQARAIGTLPADFIIFGSQRDRALNLSATLTRSEERLGNLKDISRLADLKVTYLDVQAFAKGSGHFPVATSPALLQVLNKFVDVNQALEADQRNNTGLVASAILTAQSATRIIIAPVVEIAQAR